MTFTINNCILQINFIFKIHFDPQHPEKTSNSVFRDRLSLFRSNSERKTGFFSGHSCLRKERLLPIKSKWAV